MVFTPAKVSIGFDSPVGVPWLNRDDLQAKPSLVRGVEIDRVRGDANLLKSLKDVLTLWYHSLGRLWELISLKRGGWGVLIITPGRSRTTMGTPRAKEGGTRKMAAVENFDPRFFQKPVARR